jgi:hypothetical protein
MDLVAGLGEEQQPTGIPAPLFGVFDQGVQVTWVNS